MPTLQELQAAEAAQGAAKLRTFQLEFARVFAYCPLFAREVSTWLATPNLDLFGMAERMAPKLEQANAWLVAYEELNLKLKNSEAMKAYMGAVKLSANHSTLPSFIERYSTVLQKAEAELHQQREQAKRRQAEAAQALLRQEEAAKDRRRQAEVAQELQRQAEAAQARLRQEEAAKELQKQEEARRLDETSKFRMEPWMYVFGALIAAAAIHKLFDVLVRDSASTAAPAPPAYVIGVPEIGRQEQASPLAGAPSQRCGRNCTRTVLAVWNNGVWAGFNSMQFDAASIRQTPSGFLVLAPVGSSFLEKRPGKFWSPQEMDAKAEGRQWIMVTLDETGKAFLHANLSKRVATMTYGLSFLDIRVN